MISSSASRIYFVFCHIRVGKCRVGARLTTSDGLTTLTKCARNFYPTYLGTNLGRRRRSVTSVRGNHSLRGARIKIADWSWAGSRDHLERTLGYSTWLRRITGSKHLTDIATAGKWPQLVKIHANNSPITAFMAKHAETVILFTSEGIINDSIAAMTQKCFKRTHIKLPCLCQCKKMNFVENIFVELSCQYASIPYFPNNSLISN